MSATQTKGSTMTPDPFPEREATATEAERLKAAGWTLTGLGTLWIVPSDALEAELNQRFFSTDEALLAMADAIAWLALCATGSEADKRAAVRAVASVANA